MQNNHTATDVEAKISICLGGLPQETSRALALNEKSAERNGRESPEMFVFLKMQYLICNWIYATLKSFKNQPLSSPEFSGLYPLCKLEFRLDQK